MYNIIVLTNMYQKIFCNNYVKWSNLKYISNKHSFLFVKTKILLLFWIILNLADPVRFSIWMSETPVVLPWFYKL